MVSATASEQSREIFHESSNCSLILASDLRGTENEHEPFSANPCGAPHSWALIQTLAAGTGSTWTWCHT